MISAVFHASESPQTLKQILTDPNISSWLKDAIKAAYERDPVDALRDGHRLLKVLGERYTQIVNQTRVLSDPSLGTGDHRVAKAATLQ